MVQQDLKGREDKIRRICCLPELRGSQASDVHHQWMCGPNMKTAMGLSNWCPWLTFLDGSELCTGHSFTASVQLLNSSNAGNKVCPLSTSQCSIF